MPHLRSIPESELPLGDPLPWNLYDRWGELLLKEGAYIRDEGQMRDIVHRGPCFMAPDEIKDPFADDRSRLHIGTPFDVNHKCVRHLERVCAQPSEVLTFPLEIESIARALQRAIERDEDAAIASLMLMEEGRHCIRHQIETAIVCAAILRQLEIEPKTSLDIVCAALTMNLAALELHEAQHLDPRSMDERARARMNLHPTQSTTLLKELGIQSSEWLTSVLHLLELLDGTGYPLGLVGSRISFGAQVIQIADAYTDRTSLRSRKARDHSGTALTEIVRSTKDSVNPDLAKILIRIVDVFTPGTWVNLENGEVSLVIRRGKTLRTPIVMSFASRGLALGAPFVRDTAVERFACKGAASPPRLEHQLNPRVLWGLVLPKL